MNKRYRSAETGEYVTEEYAKANPATTVSEEVEDEEHLFARSWKEDDGIPF